MSRSQSPIDTQDLGSPTFENRSLVELMVSGEEIQSTDSTGLKITSFLCFCLTEHSPHESANTTAGSTTASTSSAGA